jgi:hypothetical protein
MPEPINDKTLREPVRIVRERDGAKELEDGWTLVRLEADSGNVVCERNGTRVNCGRREFELLNFPGSNDIWAAISDPRNDDDLQKAKRSWVEFDLRGVVAALIRHASRLDPAFGGIQTIADMDEKVREIEAICKRSMDIARIEVKRAQNEYERCPLKTTFDRDRKENLLDCVRDRENRYAALAYRYETQLPIWQKLVSAIKNIDAIDKK